ncbi:MAG TPA: hypothetical protein VF552_12845 [Allosphingosinicella sp.]|jgi:uncharacterized membrane protein YeaQ/YmgE (transglycosylase-associated protein family)
MFELLWFGGIFGAIAAAMIVNWRRDRTPLRTIAGGLVPGAVVIGLPVLLRRFGIDLYGHPILMPIVLAAMGALLLLLTWRLVRSWQDEEQLAQGGPQDGYLVRARLVPPRTRALLGVAVYASILALFAYFHFTIRPE